MVGSGASSRNRTSDTGIFNQDAALGINGLNPYILPILAVLMAPIILKNSGFCNTNSITAVNNCLTGSYA